MSETADLPLGTRVRLRAPSPLVTLASDAGTVVARDVLGYYIVRLDRPAVLHHGQDDEETLTEIVEDADNLEVIAA